MFHQINESMTIVIRLWCDKMQWQKNTNMEEKEKKTFHRHECGKKKFFWTDPDGRRKSVCSCFDFAEKKKMDKKKSSARNERENAFYQLLLTHFFDVYSTSDNEYANKEWFVITFYIRFGYWACFYFTVVSWKRWWSTNTS